MIEVFSIIAVVVTAYLFLSILGTRPSNAFLSIEERSRWSNALSSRFGYWLYVSNVVATLTSLATVYVFFIGTSKLFGYYVFACIISIIIGAVVTNKITSVVSSIPVISERLSDQTTASSAIASLFWSPKTKSTSAAIKYITLTAICCVLWLEFATLTKLFSNLIFARSMVLELGVMFVAVFFTFDFTIRNGLRGFIFADLILFPLIAFGVIALLAGASIAMMKAETLSLNNLLAPPQIPEWQAFIFVIATVFLNSFIVITSESHWLRVWTMPNQVKKATFNSMLWTALVWVLLIAIGLLLVGVTSKFGLEGVVEIINHLKTSSHWYSVAFWVAAAAAIVSTVDSQVYSFLVLAAFDVETGTVRQTRSLISQPSMSAIAVASCFTGALAIVEYTKIPFEPVVFFIFPIFLCAAPGFVEFTTRRTVSPGPIYASIVLYLLCGLAMIALPELSFPISFAAPLMPALVCAYLLATRSNRSETTSGTQTS